MKNFEIIRDARAVAVDELVARIMARYAARDCVSQKRGERDESGGKAKAHDASEKKAPFVDHAPIPPAQKMAGAACSS